MDFCQKVEQDYPYAHAIGNIRAIIGADWIKPTEKVKRVQAVLDELNQRVLERCAGGTDTNVPTMPAGQPLTLEQLRGMVGKPAFLPEVNCNVLIARNEGVPLFTFSDGSQVSAVDWYEEVGAAYAYYPAHIDREAWTGCICNTKSKSCCTCVSLRCQFCIGESEYKRGKYCSACGRPLTEEAWAELEQRMEGLSHAPLSQQNQAADPQR